MIGTKHKWTLRQRTEHIVTNVETSEAMATFMAEYEQDEQRALEELSPDDVTNWPDMLHQPTYDDSPAVSNHPNKTSPLTCPPSELTCPPSEPVCHVTG